MAAKRRKINKKNDRPFDWTKYSKRHVALKVAYLGWDYCGLVIQKNISPTVEVRPPLQNLRKVTLTDTRLSLNDQEKLMEALLRTKLIEDPVSCKYARCGRTDKGVSAFGQVVSVILRSNCSDGVGIISKGYGQDEGPEIDYVTMLNHHLPEDIRIISWCPVPANFDARFTCSWRMYRYFFVRHRLNIEAMHEAAQYLVGEHDYRNFCKMDAQNVHNYKRTIFSYEIEPQDDGRDLNDEKKMFAFVIRGRAFLWHQVRCMTSILMLVGKGKEKPRILLSVFPLFFSFFFSFFFFFFFLALRLRSLSVLLDAF
jgi:tRNA pseudouridine38/39 synthase